MLLFAVGFVYGAIMMRYVIFLFFEKSVELALGNVLDITMLVSKIITTSVLMGLAFQFPIILTLLMRLNILKYKDVSKQRALAWVVALFFAAFMPPTDILSLLLLTLPLVLLFEFTLLLNRSILKSHLL
jgi:sec-independent protein translocase protein TatC